MPIIALPPRGCVLTPPKADLPETSARVEPRPIILLSEIKLNAREATAEGNDHRTSSRMYACLP